MRAATTKAIQIQQSVIRFWFGSDLAANDLLPSSVIGSWYGGPSMDDKVRDAFGDLVEEMMEGKHVDEWQTTGSGCLAYIVCTDQFTRNLYRNSPKAFQLDPVAVKVARHAIDTGLVNDLVHPMHKVVLYHPFMHSESVEDQDYGVQLFQDLADETAAAEHPNAGSVAHGSVFMVKHRDIVAKFGRFPHRNDVLGRESTAEEVAAVEAGAKF